MYIQNREDAIKIWEKDKYIDWGNYHYIDTDDGLKIEPIQIHNKDCCKNCEIVDELYEKYYKFNSDVERSTDKQDIIINSILKYVMNAYGLLKLRESFGFDLEGKCIDGDYEEGINDISHYLYYSGYSEEELKKLKAMDPKTNEIRIDRARWCKSCGARKPDIIL